MSTNTMSTKYQRYGLNQPLLIRMVIIMAIALFILILVDKLTHASFEAIIIQGLVYVSVLMFLPILQKLDVRFFADDVSVVFKEAFCREIRIQYIDIYEMEVNHHLKPVRHGHANVDRYIESITFWTNDGEEYTFNAIMDIRPNSREASVLGTERIFEMGKFSLLQQFIEKKKSIEQ